MPLKIEIGQEGLNDLLKFFGDIVLPVDQKLLSYLLDLLLDCMTVNGEIAVVLYLREGKAFADLEAFFTFLFKELWLELLYANSMQYSV